MEVENTRLPSPNASTSAFSTITISLTAAQQLSAQTIQKVAMTE